MEKQKSQSNILGTLPTSSYPQANKVFMVGYSRGDNSVRNMLKEKDPLIRKEDFRFDGSISMTPNNFNLVHTPVNMQITPEKQHGKGPDDEWKDPKQMMHIPSINKNDNTFGKMN